MKEHDPVFGDLHRLVAITQGLDERGLVLSLAAFADEALAKLILAFMQPGDASKALVEGFNAPLGTFSARIKAASALGLITGKQHRNLDRFRRIRNKFAHNWEIISFTDQAVAAHIAALEFSPMVAKFPENSNDKLHFIISALLIEIRSFTHQIATRNLSAKTISYELMPGVSSEIEDEAAECEKNLREIVEELKTSDGDRKNYLIEQRERWNSILRITRIKGSTRTGL